MTPASDVPPSMDFARFEERWKYEDDRWERHALNNELAQALYRVGDASNPVMRIYGARCLTDLALKQLQGNSGALMSEKYPFFAPAANCLAAAVPLEEHPAVRYEIRVALNALIQFAREGGQRMLYVLIQALAEANRAALRAFTDTLGRYLAKHGAEERALPPLLGFLSFSANKEATLRCLITLAQDPEVEALRDRQAALRIAQATFGEPAASGNNTLIDTLAVRGARLLDARDALANALHALTPPPPESEASSRAFEEWRNTRRLYLYGVFLVGARLCGTQLPGCILAKAHLEGANLEGANLLAADLAQSYLFGAELYNATLDDKNRPQLRAMLREADWWNASANSWRGTPGQAILQWLTLNFPQPEPEEEAIVPDDDNDNGLTDEMMAKIHGPKLSALVESAPTPLPATEMVNGAVGLSAAEKIAELKRRASGRVAEEIPATTGGTALREKSLPNGIPARNGGPSVQVRENGRPRPAEVTNSDLLGVTDLMKGR
ncbi:MAG: pentapeptide repeat-containing protein [Capsulimonadales bacterium]|nr:pentapeptide repeat-containing protein [Capsulimonadales bacterium]